MEALGLRVNTPEVIHETIDGEVIIINLASGNYYSLKGCGAEVWTAIQESPGQTPSELATAVADGFRRSRTEVEVDVRRFLEELRAEDLIAEGGVLAEPAAELRVGAANGTGSNRTFEPPVLEKFTDMQDLVLLDPVHEVDATGWPHQKPGGSAAGAA